MRIVLLIMLFVYVLPLHPLPPIRDIPMPLVSSGVEHGNLRELALARMKDMGTEVRLRAVLGCSLRDWTPAHMELIGFSSWAAIRERFQQTSRFHS